MESIRLVSNPNSKNIVTRRNDLIEARYKLTVQEQRLMYWVMSCVEPDDEEFKTYRVSISELSKAIGGSNKDLYGRLRKVTKKVMGRVIEMQEGNRLIQIPLINKAIYNNGDGTVDIRLDEDLQQYLLQLKGEFTQVRVKYLFALSSSYAMRIYELMVQYRKIGKRTETVEDLRMMLDVDPEQYQRWAHFEDRVLKRSQTEINEKTDISFKYEKIKKGRRIHAVSFVIRPNKKEEVEENPSPPTEQYSELILMGVTARIAQELIKEYEPERIAKSIQYTHKQGSSVDDVPRYLVHVIKNGYGQEVMEYQEKTRLLKQEKEAQERRNEQKEKEKNRKDKEYSNYERSEIEKLVLRWDETERAENWLRLERDAQTSIFPFKFVKKTGLDKWLTPFHRTAVLNYLIQNEGLELLSREEYK